MCSHFMSNFNCIYKKHINMDKEISHKKTIYWAQISGRIPNLDPDPHSDPDQLRVHLLYGKGESTHVTWDSGNPDFSVRHRVRGLTRSFGRPEIWAQITKTPMTSVVDPGDFSPDPGPYLIIFASFWRTFLFIFWMTAYYSKICSRRK
jgi:hypothetical protein